MGPAGEATRRRWQRLIDEWMDKHWAGAIAARKPESGLTALQQRQLVAAAWDRQQGALILLVSKPDLAHIPTKLHRLPTGPGETSSRLASVVCARSIAGLAFLLCSVWCCPSSLYIRAGPLEQCIFAASASTERTAVPILHTPAHKKKKYHPDEPIGGVQRGISAMLSRSLHAMHLN